MIEEMHIQFPEFTGLRCLMMPYVQGDPDSVPEAFAPYRSILETVFRAPCGTRSVKSTRFDGDIGHLAAEYPYSAAKVLRAGEVSRVNGSR